MIQMKRHMMLASTSTSSSSGNNPYLQVEEHTQETLAVAESIVRCCSSQQSFNDDASLQNLSSSVERFVALISPTEQLADTATKIGDTHKKQCASYDSSLSGIAANAILTCLVSCPESEKKKYLAFLLADALAFVLGVNATSSSLLLLQSIQSQAAIALTQLSATEPPPPPVTSYGGFSSTYQNPTAHDASPTSWCFVMVNSNALEALIQKITLMMTTPATKPTIPRDVDTIEKCVWAIGNLAGDSEMAREALVDKGAIPRLIGCVSFGLHVLMTRHNAVQSSLLMNLLRNSVWALVNFAREGMLTLNDLSGDGGGLLLSNECLASLLLLPTTVLQEHSDSSSDKNHATSHDVAKETCWLLALLTEKDTKTIECIREANSPVLSAVVTLLSFATDAASQLYECSSMKNDEMKQLLSEKCMSVIPICRLMRSMAFENDVADSALLTFTPATTTLCQPPERSLAKLISLGTLGAGQDASIIASIAAETAGAFLYYAGSCPSHPSNTACNILIPALCQALISPLATFDVKRETVWALWNASSNEGDDGAIERGDEEFQTVFQRQLVMEMANTSPPEFMRSLTSLLSTDDMDTIYPAMRLIDALLSRLEPLPSGKKLSVIFEEVGLVDALWRICDNDSDESDVAEMAANILDEYYEGEDSDDVEELLAPSSTGDIFQFHAPSSFAPVGGFDFSSNNPNISVGEQQEPRPQMGRGRGRGQQIPSWMKQSQQT